MNRCRVFLVCVLVATIELIAVPSTKAQNLFNALVSVTSVSTNQGGSLVYQHVGNADLISRCAAEQGLTNLSALSLSFNLSADALQVVTSTNNAEVGTKLPIVDTNMYVVCTPLTFMNIVSLTGTNTNKVELLASVFVETNTTASGTLAATERFGSGSNTNSFSLVGSIQYAVTASGTNGPAIYRGALLVGSAANENEGEDNEGSEHGNGNNGNHGNGNNGNHGNGNNGNHGNGNNGNGHGGRHG